MKPANLIFLTLPLGVGLGIYLCHSFSSDVVIENPPAPLSEYPAPAESIPATPIQPPAPAKPIDENPAQPTPETPSTSEKPMPTPAQLQTYAILESKLYEPGVTIDTLFLDPQMQTLSDEMQTKLLIEIARRLNSGELNSDQFLPGSATPKRPFRRRDDHGN